MWTVNGEISRSPHDMSADRLDEALTGGIGLSNVNERLRVIYGEHCQLRLKSTPEQGTSVSMEA